MKSLVLRNRVAIYRNARGLTQSDLALRCGVSKNTISNIETGSCGCTAFLAAKMCNVLHCKFNDLFTLYKFTWKEMQIYD